jgi:hypothetical protein
VGWRSASPPEVEIALAAEDTAATRAAGDELAAAATYGSSGLEAASRQAGGAVLCSATRLWSGT